MLNYECYTYQGGVLVSYQSVRYVSKNVKRAFKVNPFEAKHVMEDVPFVDEELWCPLPEGGPVFFVDEMDIPSEEVCVYSEDPRVDCLEYMELE